MREIRQSGSEGGGAEHNRLSLPLSATRERGAEGREGSFQGGAKEGAVRQFRVEAQCLNHGRGSAVSPRMRSRKDSRFRMILNSSPRTRTSAARGREL